MSTAEPNGGIDCHAHVFSADAPAMPGARYRPAYAATLEGWMAQWRASGITHGVLVQPSFFGSVNRELVVALKRHPDRLRGVAVVGPEVGEAQLAALDEAGVRAIRLNLQGMGDSGVFATAPWPALFARIAALGWHVEAFVEPGRAPELLRALEGTSMPVVFDHCANPGPDAQQAQATFAALAASARERATWVKLSGPYRLGGADPQALAQRAIEAVGADRIVWGSDWPWTRHEHGRDYAALRMELDRWVGAERSPAVLWDNPARLYRFN
jgi:predicted TIM-barrel fold metal-dependent hydrolase